MSEVEQIKQEIKAWLNDNVVGKPHHDYPDEILDERYATCILHETIFYGYEYVDGGIEAEFVKFLVDKYNYVHIETDGGEDQGSYAYAVFEMNGKTYRIETTYYSYDGYGLNGDFWDWEEVEPYSEVVTKYKKRG